MRFLFPQGSPILLLVNLYLSRVLFLRQMPIPLFTTIVGAIPDSFLTMETSFSLAHKTSMFECMTPQILIIGNITKPSSITMGNGLSRMLRSARTIVILHIVQFEVLFLWRPQILMTTVSRHYWISQIWVEGIADTNIQAIVTLVYVVLRTYSSTNGPDIDKLIDLVNPFFW